MSERRHERADEQNLDEIAGVDDADLDEAHDADEARAFRAIARAYRSA